MEDTYGGAVPVILFSIFLSIILRSPVIPVIPVVPVVPVVPVLAAWQAFCHLQDVEWLAGNHRSWVWVKRRVPPRCDDLLHTTRWKLWAPDMGSVKHPTFCRLWSYGYGSYEAVKTGVTLVVASDLNWS